MKIAFATPELHSLVRRTQLSEIAEQLPRTLQGLGADVRVFLPHSRDIDTDSLGPLEESALLRIRDGQSRTPITIRTGYIDGLTVHLIDHQTLFRSRHPYGDENGPVRRTTGGAMRSSRAPYSTASVRSRSHQM